MGSGCGGRRRVENEVALRVGFTVTEIAFIVVVSFFAHCDEEDEGEWCDVCCNKAYKSVDTLVVIRKAMIILRVRRSIKPKTRRSRK